MYYFMHTCFMCHVSIEESKHKSQDIKIPLYKLVHHNSFKIPRANKNDR